MRCLLPAATGTQEGNTHVFQIGTILEPVARGFGFTVLPRFAVAAYANQRAIRIDSSIPPLVDSLWLIHRAQWPLSASAGWAVRQLRQQDWSMGMHQA